MSVCVSVPISSQNPLTGMSVLVTHPIEDEFRGLHDAYRQQWTYRYAVGILDVQPVSHARKGHTRASNSALQRVCFYCSRTVK